MGYTEVSIAGLRDFDPEIIIAQLGELGFESFAENEEGLQAYVPDELFVESEVTEYLENLKQSVGIGYEVQKIADRNWNAEWESAYEPVTISGQCLVRAPFHETIPGIQFDIVIEPKMSFGTAHHETTTLMLEMILKENLDGKRLLDMGCGTGVLAILAKLKNADSVVAIDTDEWAYENAVENVKRNGCESITVIRGDVDSVPLPEYDVIIANINRNVLLADIPRYSEFLNEEGALFLSGFYESDMEQINEAAITAGLHLVGYRTENNWVGVKYSK